MRWTEAQLASFRARKGGSASKPARPRKRTSRLEPSENQIHVAVVEHLRARCLPGVHWHHPATGELRDDGTARKLQRMGARAGLPDLLLLIDGRLHGLELKRDHGGRLSHDQRAMHQELIAAGAVVATAHGVDQALAILAAWDVFATTNTKQKGRPR